MDTLYERIISLCKDRGITGGKMCTDLHMSKGTLTDLKMGRQKSLSAEKAQKIATYLNVSVGYLLGEEEQKENSPSELVLTEGEKDLLELFRLIPENQQPVVLAMIRAALIGK